MARANTALRQESKFQSLLLHGIRRFVATMEQSEPPPAKVIAQEIPDPSANWRVWATIRRRSTLLILIISLLVLAGCYYRNAPTRLAHYTDPLIYLSGAQSIAEGNGYRFAAHAGTPKIGCQPPLQSTYLSLFWRLYPRFPENISLLYGAMVLCAFGTFILFYRYCLKSGVPPIIAGLLIIAWGLSMPWGVLIYSFMSDILFGFFCIVLASYWRDADDIDSWRRWFVSGVIVTLMYLTRTAALAVLLMLGLVVAWRAIKWRKIKPLIAYLTPLIPALVLWKIWGAEAPRYSDYMRFRFEQEGGWSQLIRCWMDSAQQYLLGLDFGQALFPSLMELPSRQFLTTTVWSPILTALIVILCWSFTFFWVTGCWRSGTAKERIFGLVVAAYLGQLCLYPAHMAERVLYAVLPFVLVWAWKGTSVLPRRFIASKALQWGTVAFLIVNIIGNAGPFTRMMNYLDSCSRPEELKEVAEWLRSNSLPDAVVAATLSEPIMHFYNYSGRRVVENNLHSRPELKFSVANHSINGSRKADYVLLCWYSPLKIEDCNVSRLHLAKSSSRGTYRLYRLEPGP